MRQQGGRNLHKRNTTHVTGGCKTGHVANDSAAQGKENRLAVAAVLQQGVKDEIQRLPVLVFFAVGEFEGVNNRVPVFQGVNQLRTVQGANR